jgi:hypothetical protein
VTANLINLEFMFDDQGAVDYEIYRYFGLYVNEVPEFEIDSTVSKHGYFSIDTNTINPIYEIEDGSLISVFNLLPTDKDLSIPTLNYYKAGSGEYFHIKNNTTFKSGTLPLSFDNIENVIDNFKKDDVVKMLNGTTDHRGFVRIEIIENPNHNDKFLVGDLTEIESVGYNLNDFIFIADSNLAPGSFNGQRFSSNGTLLEVTMALNNAIQFHKTEFKSNILLINDIGSGQTRKRMVVAVHNQNFSNFINFETAKKHDFGIHFNDWNTYTSAGGSVEGAIKLVSQEEIGKLKVGDYVKSKDLTKYVKIVDISPNLLDDTKYRVIFDQPVKITNSASIQTWVKYRPVIGKFNAYNIADFDFDFYSGKMSDIGELSLEDDQYFKNLTNVLPAETVNTPEYINIDSEYDRLNENELKETALLSRIIPTINKFALKNGTNARNLPYILSVSEAFGPDNISPDINYAVGRNVDYLNMEHFHINSVPEKYYQSNTLDNLQSYVDFDYSGGISEDQLKSIDTNYFELYLTHNGVYNGLIKTWQDTKSRDMFTLFSGGSLELESSTVFRGLRYSYKKRKEFGRSAPVDFINTTEVNGYKFGTILNYITGEDVNNKVEYKVIKNDKFKFICVLINLYVIDNSVKYLDRKSLYELNDILDSSGNIINIDLPFQIIFDYDNNEDYWSAKTIRLYGAQNPRFTEYITTDDLGQYSWIYFEHNGFTYGLKVTEVVNDGSIIVESKPIQIEIDQITNELAIVPDGNGDFIYLENPEDISRNKQFSYWRGGKGSFKLLLREVVANRFADRFNQYGNIEYLTVTASGEELLNRFVLNVEDGVEVIKASILDTVKDSDRPKAYQFSNTDVGSVLSKRSDGGYFTKIRRMNGDYNPLFRDVISFTDIYTASKIIMPNIGETTIQPVYREDYLYSRLNNLNVAFDTFKSINSNFGFIRNYFYHKASDINAKNLLKLSDTTSKLPLYPKIGEIAIDKKDLNILRSKYNQKYFTRALSGGASEEVHGTLSPVEIKSFMASTVMKVKDTYSITSFNTTLQKDLNELDSIRFNKLNSTSVHWIETDSQIIADFYLPKAFYNELLEDSILPIFRKYVEAQYSYDDKTSIVDDLEEYVYSNIVNRFIIDNIEVYGTSLKGTSSSINSIIDPSTISDGGYNIETGYEIQSYQDDRLSFRLIFSKKLGYGHSLRVHVKLQA